MTTSDRKGRKPRETSPSQVKRQEQRRQALALRMTGATFEEIARVMGFENRSTAKRTVDAALKDTAKDIEGTADELRTLELARLDRVQRAIWPRVLGDATTPPDLKAVDRLLRIMQRRADLTGLDAPKRLGIGGGDDATGPVPVEVTADATVDELAALLNQLAEQKAALDDGHHPDPAPDREDPDDDAS